MLGPLIYDDSVEVLAKTYGERVLALLARVRDELVKEGFTIACEPGEMFGDDYRWSLLVQRPDTDDEDNRVDITVQIAESRDYDGYDGGVSFTLDLVEWGGRILGGLAPYNYTDQCWVPMGRADEVEQRWSILEDSDVSTIPDLIGGEQ